MKLITRNTDYAIRALTCVAGSSRRVVDVNSLSARLKMPRPFLRKILQTLNKEGLLRSYKGKGGGFSLARKPFAISIFDVIKIFQGPFCMSRHVFKGGLCPMVRTCRLKKELDRLEKQVINRLKAITIASLVKR